MKKILRKINKAITNLVNLIVLIFIVLMFSHGLFEFIDSVEWYPLIELLFIISAFFLSLTYVASQMDKNSKRQ